MNKEYWYNPKSDKTIAKRKRRLNKRISRNKYVNKIEETAAKNSLFRADLTRKATQAELIFGDYLWENNIYFIFQKGFFKPFHRIVDFYLPNHDLIIEIDGGYHESIKHKDDYKDKVWSRDRYKETLRFKNSEILDDSFKDKLTILGII